MFEFLTIFLVFYIWHALGICIGYHRLLSHRTFVTSKFMEYLLVLPGYLAFEGSPIWWSVMHRAHHRHVDTELDPHSPRFGLFHAHIGWTLDKTYRSHIDPHTQAKDLVNDPIYKFLEQGGDWSKAHAINFGIGFGFRAILWALFGWQVALASLLAGLAVLQIPLMLNVFCHMTHLGYKNYSTEDDSVNVWWVGILACGEGWHNNHHASPGSAQSGMKPLEFDLAWQVIKLLRALNLVRNVNVIPHERLVARFGEPGNPKLVAEPAVSQAVPAESDKITQGQAKSESVRIRRKSLVTSNSK
jgi:stearoyl-CoA desaturase (delta-9 desaturase)